VFGRNTAINVVAALSGAAERIAAHGAPVTRDPRS
jgi:hypothetical protein